MKQHRNDKKLLIPKKYQRVAEPLLGCLLVIGLIAVIAPAPTHTALISPEVHFADRMPDGLEVVPASGASNPPAPVTPAAPAAPASPTGDTGGGSQQPVDSSGGGSGSGSAGTDYTDTSCPAGETYESGSCVVDSCPSGEVEEGGVCIVSDGGSDIYLPPSPPPPPSGTISVTPTLIKIGETTQVAWSAQNVTECTVSGTDGEDWSGASGTDTSTPIPSQVTYTLSCFGLDGSTLTEQATVNIVPSYQGDLTLWALW